MATRGEARGLQAAPKPTKAQGQTFGWSATAVVESWDCIRAGVEGGWVGILLTASLAMQAHSLGEGTARSPLSSLKFASEIRARSPAVRKVSLRPSLFFMEETFFMILDAILKLQSSIFLFRHASAGYVLLCLVV